MQRSTRWIVVAMVAGLALSACSKQAAEPDETGHATVKLEAVKGQPDLKRVILSAEAVKRIDVKTVKVRDAQAEAGATQKVIPYAAVLYDADGKTWAYANPGLRTFLRHADHGRPDRRRRRVPLRRPTVRHHHRDDRRRGDLRHRVRALQRRLTGRED